jgi:hypothetical protein
VTLVSRKQPLGWTPLLKRNLKKTRAREAVAHSPRARVCPCGHATRLDAPGALGHTCVYAREELDPLHQICVACKDPETVSFRFKVL